MIDLDDPLTSCPGCGHAPGVLPTPGRLRCSWCVVLDTGATARDVLIGAGPPALMARIVEQIDAARDAARDAE